MKSISLMFFIWRAVYTFPLMALFHLQVLSTRLDTFQFRLRKHHNLKRSQKPTKRLSGYVQLHGTMVPVRLLHTPRRYNM